MQCKLIEKYDKEFQRWFLSLLLWTKYLLVPVYNWTRTGPDTTRIQLISSNHRVATRKTRLTTPLYFPIEFVLRKVRPLTSPHAPVSILTFQPEGKRFLQMKRNPANTNNFDALLKKKTNVEIFIKIIVFLLILK